MLFKFLSILPFGFLLNAKTGGDFVKCYNLQYCSYSKILLTESFNVYNFEPIFAIILVLAIFKSKMFHPYLRLDQALNRCISDSFQLTLIIQTSFFVIFRMFLTVARRMHPPPSPRREDVFHELSTREIHPPPPISV